MEKNYFRALKSFDQSLAFSVRNMVKHSSNLADLNKKQKIVQNLRRWVIDVPKVLNVHINEIHKK